MHNPLQSRNQPVQPGLATLGSGERGYASASIGGHVEEGHRKFHFAGMARISNAPTGAFAVASERQSFPSAVSSTHHVEAGRGTQVENVGFRVRTNFNSRGEPIVTIYPYGIDSTKPGGFSDPRLSRLVESLVRDVEVNGVKVRVNGVYRQVAPREIVGFTSVLDFSGTKPVQWADVKGAVTALRDVSFTFQR